MQKQHLYGFGLGMVVLGLGMGLKTPLFAQDDRPEPPPRPPAENSRPRPPRLDGPALDDMTRFLDLTAQQQQQIKAILDAAQQQISTALTTQQRAKLQEFRAHHGGPDGGPNGRPDGGQPMNGIPAHDEAPSQVALRPLDPNATRVAVVFAGGHETDPRDRGRPVVLIASALGVKPEVFREAFSHVHPAGAGTQPTDEQAQSNKKALLDALERYGITNDRLDEVSNYYRYVRSQGQMWPTENAEAYALIKKGKITGFEITKAGSGYSSAPTVTIPGLPEAQATVQLSFDPDFEQNGSVSKITLAP